MVLRCQGMCPCDKTTRQLYWKLSQLKPRPDPRNRPGIGWLSLWATMMGILDWRTRLPVECKNECASQCQLVNKLQAKYLHYWSINNSRLTLGCFAVHQINEDGKCALFLFFLVSHLSTHNPAPISTPTYNPIGNPTTLKRQNPHCWLPTNPAQHNQLTMHGAS